jgi:hypothetical protein
MKIGEIVVLRLGKNSVYGVGLIESDYQWYDDMGDVDGWDLQHCRRVRWIWKYNPESGPQIFPEGVLRWGDTVQQATSQPLNDWLQSLDVEEDNFNRSLVPLPTSCIDGEWLTRLSSDEISNYLFDRGVAADNIDALASGMSDLVRIAGWYTRTRTQPAERETVAYLVVPLLRSLGWTPQRMAIEWNRVDIALFDSLPRIESNLVAAVEAKKRWRTCFTSCTQAFSYASMPERVRCLRAVSTEGIRYSVFRKGSQTQFKPFPDAYLNLTRLVSDYPLLRCAGAREVLSLMSTDWNGSPA